MFTFNSPVISENVWKICFKSQEEMIKIYYEGREEEKKEKKEGMIEYISFTIYIDKDLDDASLLKTLRKQLMRIYLWETGQQDHMFTEEEFCDLNSVAAPLICKTANEIASRLKENGIRKEKKK